MVVVGFLFSKLTFSKAKKDYVNALNDNKFEKRYHELFIIREKQYRQPKWRKEWEAYEKSLKRAKNEVINNKRILKEKYKKAVIEKKITNEYYIEEITLFFFGNTTAPHFKNLSQYGPIYISS